MPTASPLPRFTRRRFLTGSVAAGTGLAVASSAPARATLGGLVESAARTAPAGTGLHAIDHVVILIQENRSFDHYFGTLRGVRGFDDHGPRRPGPFAQPDPVNTTRPPLGELLPFHLDTSRGDAECNVDPTHAWPDQHHCWNNGLMNGWARTHRRVDGSASGPQTMGYFTRADLPFYYSLADAFTVCDNYFCSVMGPTVPNRLYSLSATLDPDGRAGGPVVTNPSATFAPLYRWTTMPERLDAHGISWKVYQTPITGPTGELSNNVLAYFRQYQDSSTDRYRNAFLPSFPGEFELDALAGTLPQVSWVLAPPGSDEHPPAPSLLGEAMTGLVLESLTANPEVWARTALFVTYDENGGFFDHVAPPTPPAGTTGEYLTHRPLPTPAGGVDGPIGLGFRVPMLVVSPFSRGGFVNSDPFDHTSLLRFIETRFGVEVANLTAWRRRATGDLTSTLDLTHPNPSTPVLAEPNPTVLAQCTTVVTSGGNGAPFPLPATQHVPRQEPGPARRRAHR